MNKSLDKVNFLVENDCTTFVYSLVSTIFWISIPNILLSRYRFLCRKSPELVPGTVPERATHWSGIVALGINNPGCSASPVTRRAISKWGRRAPLHFICSSECWAIPIPVIYLRSLKQPRGCWMNFLGKTMSYKSVWWGVNDKLLQSSSHHNNKTNRQLSVLLYVTGNYKLLYLCTWPRRQQ